MIAAMVEEKIDTMETHITWAYIAKELNLTPSALSHFRKKKTELNFKSLLKLCKIVFPRKYIDVLADWTLILTKPSNVKVALEFLAANRKIDHLKSFHSKKETFTSKCTKELIEAYYTMIPHLESSFTSSHLPKITEKQKEVKSQEALVILEICEVYYYSTIGEIGNVVTNLEKVKNRLSLISDSLLNELYMNRIEEVESVVMLYNKADTVKARSLCEKIIKDESGFYCATFLADAYYRIGMSFLFESPDMCLKNLKKAKELYLKDNKEGSAKNIDKNEVTFAKIFWGLKILETDELEDSYTAFVLAKSDRKEEAIRVIKELNQDSPFTKYYSGIATGNNNELLESLLMFRNKGNYFYAQLPKLLLDECEDMKAIVKLILN
ncbi:AimR family lysis-lysogeny pheromone receptor [Bacillus sp. MCCB 382]|uniref:AimR family lysis-lysogeny pheromone receptor n=1 Tax=Bacillus sp. MCCB 382 TaxID=2860197 RepID=UPI001C5A5A0B|nr:AimR family lysis-lysogeny pheromone receptor [Bacillus sp. MCCB 382]